MPGGLRADAVSFAATVRKELQVTLRYPANLVVLAVTAVVVPASYVAQASGFSGGGHQDSVDAFAARAGTAEVAGFIYLGWAVFLWISLMLWGPGSALRLERIQGSLEMVHLTPVSRFTVLFGPAVAELLPAALLFGVVGLMLRFAFGIPLGPDELLAGVSVIVASVPVLFAIGALMAVVSLRFRDAEGITEVFRGALGILCGVSYPIAVLPDWIQPVSEGLPPTQILELLRGAILDHAWRTDIATRLLTLIGVGVAVGAVAVLALGGALRHARRTGQMGQY
ncbi:ABC transporter permease [Streptomyces sp. NPDC058665]|uniref:ABC transporter permease n=1 Tax=Streptomyces sp. NPDC058665 TaxID=3346586 RepID=UPI003661E6B9